MVLWGAGRPSASQSRPASPGSARQGRPGPPPLSSTPSLLHAPRILSCSVLGKLSLGEVPAVPAWTQKEEVWGGVTRMSLLFKEKTKQVNIFRCQLRSGLLCTGSLSAGRQAAVVPGPAQDRRRHLVLSEGLCFFPRPTGGFAWSCRQNLQEMGGNLNPGSLWPLISLRSQTTQAAGTQQGRAELCPEAASRRHGSRCLKPAPSVNLCFSVPSGVRGEEAPRSPCH